MNTTAVYAGSFDPPTLGHAWMIQEAARLFTNVIVAIGINPEKKSTFTLEERQTMLRHMTAEMPNIRVTSFEQQYLIRYAASVNANVIIRGVRNTQDYEYERAMRHINADLDPEITTVVLMPPRDIAEISSSTIKGLVGPDGWERVVAQYVPTVVLKNLIAKHSMLWSLLQSRGAVGDEKIFWNSIFSPYFENKRAYHTWFHIASMMTALRYIRDRLDDPCAVATAIAMHDSEISTPSQDDEKQSAVRTQQLLHHFHLPTDFIETVSNLILATKHGTETPNTNDAQYLVDMDLLILGTSEREYREYADAIRKEYAWVPDNIFMTSRLEILEMFLKRPAIYCTPYFRVLYEAIARRNLEQERDALRAKLEAVSTS